MLHIRQLCVENPDAERFCGRRRPASSRRSQTEPRRVRDRNGGMATASRQAAHDVASAPRGRRGMWKASRIQRRPRGADATIPPKVSRTQPRSCDGRAFDQTAARSRGWHGGRPARRSHCPFYSSSVLARASDRSSSSNSRAGWSGGFAPSNRSDHNTICSRGASGCRNPVLTAPSCRPSQAPRNGPPSRAQPVPGIMTASLKGGSDLAVPPSKKVSLGLLSMSRR